MEHTRIYTENHPAGVFYAEDHGADVAGVFFLGKRCKRAKYIATARVSNPDSIKRRVDWYINHANLNGNTPAKPLPFGVAIPIHDLLK